MIKSVLFSILLATHPVHVTVTSIDYVPSKKVFTVFLKMYYDDFLRDYKLTDGNTVESDFSVINEQVIEKISDYLDRRLVINVNNKDLLRTKNEIKVDGIELIMNIEYRCKNNPETVSVSNSILTDIYSDQSNMVILRVNSFEEGFKLSPGMTRQFFKIK